MRGVSFLVGVVAALSCGSASADTYWVSPTGAAAWSNGRSSTPLAGASACALSTANSNARAGDTVILRGGDYIGQIIRPANSGTSDGNRVIYTNRDGERPVIRNSHTGILVLEKSYITINGVDFRDLHQWGRVYASHHITISNCNFDGRNPSSDVYTGFVVSHGAGPYGPDSRDSTHCWIHHCTFYRWSYGAYSEHKGALLDIGHYDYGGATQNLIENNTFAYGGHHTLGVLSKQNVIRSNYIHNETNAANWNQLGYRGSYAVGPKAGRCLWEGNRFGYSTNSGLGLRSSNHIVRRNLFYRQGDGAIQVVASDDGVDNASNNRIYHNTFYRNGHLQSYSGQACGMYFARWSNGEKTIVGNVVKNNIFFDNKDGAVCNDGMALSAQVIENNWSNNANPGFVDLSGTNPNNAALPDLRLKDNSSARDGGAFLTTVTSASGSGNSFQVKDSNYFMDGWGIIEGDLIQLEGQSSPARITRVDYQSHVITVDRSLTFTRGLGVSLAYSGGAPDLGAFEINSGSPPPPSGPPAPPSNLRVVGQD